MSVPNINLLPTSRVHALHARRIGRRWIAWGGAALALFCVASVAYSVGASGGESHVEEARLVRARLDAERTRKQSLTARASDLRKRLEAAQSVGRHPDWSILVAYLWREAGKGVNIERFDLKLSRADRSSKPAQRNNAPQEKVFEVTLNGSAQGMSAVSSFVQRIESADAFDRVKLGETSVDASSAQSGGTRFSISGEIYDAAGGTP
jgi:hypothetical protein